jgi:hypothetical protein
MSSANSINQQRFLQVLEGKRSAVLESLNNGASWSYTIKANISPDVTYGISSNSNLEHCLNDSTFDCPQTVSFTSVLPTIPAPTLTQGFYILLASSENNSTLLKFVSSGTGTRGFKRNGEDCIGFGTVPDCAFRYSAFVLPDCATSLPSPPPPPTSCKQPAKLVFRATLETSSLSNEKIYLKNNKYDVEVIKE